MGAGGAAPPNPCADRPKNAHRRPTDRPPARLAEAARAQVRHLPVSVPACTLVPRNSDHQPRPTRRVIEMSVTPPRSLEQRPARGETPTRGAAPRASKRVIRAPCLASQLRGRAQRARGRRGP